MRQVSANSSSFVRRRCWVKNCYFILSPHAGISPRKATAGAAPEQHPPAWKERLLAAPPAAVPTDAAELSKAKPAWDASGHGETSTASPHGEAGEHGKNSSPWKLSQERRRLGVLLPILGAIVFRTVVMASTAMGYAYAGPSLDGTWRLVSVDSRPVRPLPADQVPFFTISGTTISGFDGCNSFFGRLDQPGDISSTRRGCTPATIKLPLDFGDLRSHLQTGTVNNNLLSVPARGQFPASIFERTE